MQGLVTIVMLGAVAACSTAGSSTDGATSTATGSATATTTGRAAQSPDIDVTLNPSRTVTGPGKTVEITANCPRAGNRPPSAKASSAAFVQVTLDAVAQNAPGVKGTARLDRTDIPPTRYVVTVTCDNNHFGEATLEVLGSIPTRGPKAGGGGTAGGGPEEQFPLGVAVAIAAALALGVGVGLARRRRTR